MGKRLHKRAVYGGQAITARFDNAQNTPELTQLFMNADSLAATNALNPAVRKIVRERARYVVANCPYAGSMLKTFVTHVVGPWASVSFKPGELPDSVRDRVTEDFDAWAMASGFWPKVKTMLRAKVTDGEAFAVFVTDRKIIGDANAVSLNLRLVECDRVRSYTEAITREDEIDGIRFDPNGHPMEYRILRYHPGDYRAIRDIQTKGGEWVKADSVIHYFDVLRAEQVRGISDFAPALDIPVLQKSYRSAVADTAVAAASVSGILHTDIVPECFEDNASIGKCAADVKPGTLFHLQRGSFITAPEGWNVTQMKAEQPTTLYGQFVRDLVAEMAACLCMPVNVAMCDSSQHNFASAKLDHMTYGDKIGEVRSSLSVDVLDRVFFAWLDEYAAINRLDARTVRALHKTEWLFRESKNNDVMKDASADNTRLNNGTATYESICGKWGIDSRRFIDQGLRERAYMLAKWRKECEAQGLPPDTPCPFTTLSAANAASANAATGEENSTTEDMLEHDTQKQPEQAATRKSRKRGGKDEAND